MGMMVAAVLGWQYRNAAYLLPLIPALALLTAGWSPVRARRVMHLGCRWASPLPF